MNNTQIDNTIIKRRQRARQHSIDHPLKASKWDGNDLKR